MAKRISKRPRMPVLSKNEKKRLRRLGMMKEVGQMEFKDSFIAESEIPVEKPSAQLEFKTESFKQEKYVGQKKKALEDIWRRRFAERTRLKSMLKGAYAEGPVKYQSELRPIIREVEASRHSAPIKRKTEVYYDQHPRIRNRKK